MGRRGKRGKLWAVLISPLRTVSTFLEQESHGLPLGGFLAYRCSSGFELLDECLITNVDPESMGELAFTLPLQIDGFYFP